MKSIRKYFLPGTHQYNYEVRRAGKLLKYQGGGGNASENSLKTHIYVLSKTYIYVLSIFYFAFH